MDGASKTAQKGHFCFEGIRLRGAAFRNNTVVSGGRRLSHITRYDTHPQVRSEAAFWHFQT